MTQIFGSPGYYDREIDLSGRTITPTGLPYGLVGASSKGRAFVPMTVGSQDDFVALNGDLDPRYPAGYAAKQILDLGRPVTFTRVLGAGANRTAANMETTRLGGVVRNAGMQVTGSVVGAPDRRHSGAVQFLAAKHVVSSSEAFCMPMFTDNSSFSLPSSAANLIRAVLFTTSDARFMVFNTDETFGPGLDDGASVDNTTTNATYRKFKLALSSSAGSTFATTDGFAGVKIFTASLDPSSTDYVGKILNTDPERFSTDKHLLYADFAVDAQIAAVGSRSVTDVNSVLILSGTNITSPNSGISSLVMRDAYGRYDTRFTTPRTPMFISQPFGGVEYDLFKVVAIDDGAAANEKYKISISSLKLSTDPQNPYGTFSLVVRAFGDTDFDPTVLEQYTNLTFDPNSENYVAKVIGDKNVFYNFDVEDADDRRLVQTGKYANRSKLIRVEMTDAVERKQVPAQCLPFGVRGIPVLNTNTSLTDLNDATLSARLGASGSFSATANQTSGSIVPPLPMRFKVTRGEVNSSPSFTGHPGSGEVVDSRLFWGVKYERNSNVGNPNVSNEINPIISAYAKFQGIDKLDVLVTGSFADSFNSNKFSLARVALSTLLFANLTGSTEQHMKEAAYIRNGVVSPSTYTITDGAWGDRLTFASLVAYGGYTNASQMSYFNRFSDYAKFTVPFYGGWDGVNIFDKAASRFNDRATSTESSSVGYGCASANYTSPGATEGVNYAGIGINNNAISSLRVACDIMSDPNISNMNIFAIPGVRDPLVVDYAVSKVQDDHQLSLYVADVPYYDFNNIRVFDGEVGRFIDVEKTAESFDGRVIDKDASGWYFPNIVIDDNTNNRRVTVPASVAALNALAYNDKVAYPWWAPAGFNRASLDFVRLTQTRINQSERAKLFDSRINPITKFPGEGYVIFSQKTGKLAKSALNSINIKRMVLEVKRLVVNVAMKLEFENITPDLYDRFVQNASGEMSMIQIKQGIERFKITCDNTNNSSVDVNANKINGRISFVPVRAVEAIFIDFIVTPSGVSFV